MAVKKKQTKAVEEEVNVVEEVNAVEVVAEDIQENTEDVKNDSIEVVEEYFDVDEEQIPEEKNKNVRIRMRVDHRCTIAMERYDLKKGQCYNVPENVRNILNNAGLLAPL